MFPTSQLKDKRITIGITGCIAAYKTCYLIRYLITQGAEVRVILTRGGEQFVTRLTLETLTNHPVYTDMFPENKFAATHHIELADWSEAAMIVPATANSLAKTANGICDDFLSTVISALHCPVVFAPAMNTHMWHNPATQRNLAILKSDGRLICEPEEGFLAEGYSGIGRLAAQDYLEHYAYLATHPQGQSLAGKKVLITAGATREYLDPARLLTNPSTGKMGFALALDALARGAEVTLIHGKTDLMPPREVNSVEVKSAEDMFNAVDSHFDACDMFVSAAAVSDFAPDSYSSHKIKKTDDGLNLKLKRTKDIIKTMAERKSDKQLVIGFAVETDAPIDNAREKMASKKLDMIVLNNPNDAGAGFGVDTNKVHILTPSGAETVVLGYKLDVAGAILQQVVETENE